MNALPQTPNRQSIPKMPALAALLAVSLLSARADSPDTHSAAPLWRDPSQPLAARVQDLVHRMTLAEKVSQLSCECPAIPRLGLPAYSHRNECLHGRATGEPGDFATVFPQAIGMAATWDAPLIHAEADAISTEARAKSNDYADRHLGDRAHRFGLSYYSPNINIFRDPRWGRGQETYGEDPFLTAQIAVAFIHGLQGDDPRYIKIIACAKHFAVHSGPEPLRHSFDPKPPERDLYETYLPAFEAAVREGHVGSVMGAYTALDGLPDCASHFLLTDLLRKQWGFDGFVISDGGAIWDVWAQHKFAPTPEAAAAATVKAGCDMCSGNVQPDAAALRRSAGWAADTLGWLHGGEDYHVLTDSVAEGLISEAEIDTAVGRELTARFRLGLFDPEDQVPWSNLDLDQNDTPEHRALALQVARESIVLLKNDGVLPLNRAKMKRLAVIGPNAASARMLLGNYSGTPSQATSILDDLKQIAGKGLEVTYEEGGPLAARNDGSGKLAPERLAQVIATAKSADAVIFVGGLDGTLEKEEANATQNPFAGFDRGDRTRIELPEPQETLLHELAATGKPVVLVNCSGSAMALPWEAEHLPAIVQAWYPGEAGGQAVAEVLFGDINPAGRLPVTFYRSTEDLPPFDSYSMSNRTYRYFNGQPLFAFGHGLSYTKFDYSGAQLAAGTCAPGDTLKLSFTVKNTGPRDGDEVAQVYFRHVHSAAPQPKLALCGLQRIHLAKGKSRIVTLDIPAERFRYWDTSRKRYVVEPGQYELLAGAAADDIRLTAPVTIAGTN
jgi:beta-glucosidase